MRSAGVARRIAVAVPAMNERDNIVRCVSALLCQTRSLPPSSAFSVHVLANNCNDDTVAVLRAAFGGCDALRIHEITFAPGKGNAGRARAAALERAAHELSSPSDLIFCTDADTVVARDWAEKTIRYFADEFDAVAGIARIHGSNWEELTAEQRHRLRQLTKYHALVSYLRRDQSPSYDRWPNHGYEGGASIALTLEMYRAAGSATRSTYGCSLRAAGSGGQRAAPPTRSASGAPKRHQTLSMRLGNSMPNSVTRTKRQKTV
jgi:GT2 family glycosyltransferase